jgi:hypothetical protein
MNRYKENKLSMYRTVLKWYQVHKTEVDAVPMLTTFITSLKEEVTVIEELNVLHQTDLSGLAAEKREVREKLEKLSIQLVWTLTAFFDHKNFTQLEEEVSFSISDLRNASDETLRARCTKLIGYATTYLAEMADYGLTQQIIDDTVKYAEKFVDVVKAPRQRIGERSSQKEKMDAGFRAVDKLIARLDKAANLLRISREDLFVSYSSARVMVDLKGKSKSPQIKTGMEGIVTDFETEQPIVGAEVKADNGKTVVKTDDEGYYRIALPAGETKIQVSYPGFTTHTETVEIEDGILFENDIELEKQE